MATPVLLKELVYREGAEYRASTLDYCKCETDDIRIQVGDRVKAVRWGVADIDNLICVRIDGFQLIGMNYDREIGRHHFKIRTLDAAYQGEQ